MAATVDPFTFRDPRCRDEVITFANAHAYEWSYLDTCGELEVTPRNVPDGWAFAWLEYVRRATTHRMAIREAFRMWRDTGTLPGLS